jgi:hypothetical protein
LKYPLELLSDIEIDAPLARTHLATCVAAYMKVGAITLDVLSVDAPEYFKMDGKPAAFAVMVLKIITATSGDNVAPSEKELQVVEELMTEDDKKAFDSAKAMYDAN